MQETVSRENAADWKMATPSEFNKDKHAPNEVN